MLFEKGILHLKGIKDNRAAAVLERAIDRAESRVRPSDILSAAIAHGDAGVLSSLSQALKAGASPEDIMGVIDAYNPARVSASEFDGRRSCFAPETLAALDDFETALAQHADREADVGLELLVRSILLHPDSDDRDFLDLFSPDTAAKALDKQISNTALPLTPLFEAVGINALRTDEFTEGAWLILKNGAVRAAELGYDRLLPPHFFLAMLAQTEDVAEHLIRLQAQPEVGPGKVNHILSDSLRLAERKSDPPELIYANFTEAAEEMLKGAQRAARKWSAEQVDTPHLMAAFLERVPDRIAATLKRSPLSLDLNKMREHLEQFLRENRTQVRREVPFRLPSTLLPSEDLTYRARTEGLPLALHLDDYFHEPKADAGKSTSRLRAPISRALYRREKNHVLLTGLRGVGKTRILWELARKAAANEIPFLRAKRFLWVDGRDVNAADSKEKLTGLLAHVSGRTDLIVCLDNLGPLLRGESGSNNKLILRTALKECRVHLVAVTSELDFADLLADDHETIEFFTRVKVEEPKKDAAQQIVEQVTTTLKAEFQVDFDQGVAARAVNLSVDYMLNERLPAKAIKVLRRACEEADYRRTHGDPAGGQIRVADVIRVVSDLTGVPEGVLSGAGEKTDYEKSFTAMVVGQADAVKAVATELRLIKAGLTDPGKPASVMFFAGLTGTGKTELAKTLAQFYSTSKRLQVYTMGNFTEPHSVSGIIGVPPGYVGHDQGGRLINDLNSDPYGVFLLDEAEKAHPDVWKPFLNLFDEGWIVDQRGVKAFADRAIFILTSNAGHEIIADKTAHGEDIDAIVEVVRNRLTKLKQERSDQPTFSPEFLARIRRIIIFRALTEDGMKGICDRIVERMQKSWLEKREKKIIVSEALKKHIAEQSHVLDEKSGYKEGGRVVRKLVSDLIESAIQNEAERREAEYQACNTIQVGLRAEQKVVISSELTKDIAALGRVTEEAGDNGRGNVRELIADLLGSTTQNEDDDGAGSTRKLGIALSGVEVSFTRIPPPTPEQTLEQAVGFLRAHLEGGEQGAGAAHRALSACLERLSGAEIPEETLDRFREAQRRVEDHLKFAARGETDIIAELVRSVRPAAEASHA
jgi:ATP-dependent Clp protease ATP-binding subunit ClpA